MGPAHTGAARDRLRGLRESRLRHQHGDAPYILFAYIGLIPWNFFSFSLTRGGQSLVLDSGVINKVRCPREVFPLAGMASAGIDMFISLFVLGAMFIATGYELKTTVVWVPLILLLQLAFVAGIVDGVRRSWASTSATCARRCRCSCSSVCSPRRSRTGSRRIPEKCVVALRGDQPAGRRSSTAIARRCCTGTRPRWDLCPAGVRRGARVAGRRLPALQEARDGYRRCRLTAASTRRACGSVSAPTGRRGGSSTTSSSSAERCAADRDRPQRWRWALRDIDFDVAPGESVGLVGSNGSGKSTLLKILHRVMYPYAGSVEVVGRVGALIEVRSGIHPQLTGRENIVPVRLAPRAWPPTAVASRFDEIVAFAELEQAIDRQVKFYSSGMQMRLGFAVAAFLEPDVLLVDEVLAVGDAAFQQRCLDRMRYVLTQGTTLVLVSHDLAAVEATCARGDLARRTASSLGRRDPRGPRRVPGDGRGRGPGRRARCGAGADHEGRGVGARRRRRRDPPSTRAQAAARQRRPALGPVVPRAHGGGAQPDLRRGARLRAAERGDRRPVSHRRAPAAPWPVRVVGGGPRSRGS